MSASLRLAVISAADPVDRQTGRLARAPRRLPVAAAQVADPKLAGARARAVEDLRAAIIAGPRAAAGDSAS